MAIKIILINIIIKKLFLNKISYFSSYDDVIKAQKQKKSDYTVRYGFVGIPNYE